MNCWRYNNNDDDDMVEEQNRRRHLQVEERCAAEGGVGRRHAGRDARREQDGGYRDDVEDRGRLEDLKGRGGEEETYCTLRRAAHCGRTYKQEMCACVCAPWRVRSCAVLLPGCSGWARGNEHEWQRARCLGEI